MDSVRRSIRPSIDPFGSSRPGPSGLPASTNSKAAAVSRFRQSIGGPQSYLGASRQSLYSTQGLNVPPSTSKLGPMAYGRTPMRR